MLHRAQPDGRNAVRLPPFPRGPYADTYQSFPYNLPPALPARGHGRHRTCHSQELHGALSRDSNDAIDCAAPPTHTRIAAAETVMSRLSPEELFQNSRVFAQGWNAARTWSLRTGPAAVKAMTNPYTSEPQRSRWDEGYAGALESYHTGLKFVPGQSPRGPGAK
jgi:hypothetical protein